jgi:hypothetical protein
MICPTGEAKYFCTKDWTTQISLRSHDDSPRMRNGVGWLMWPIRSDTVPHRAAHDTLAATSAGTSSL